MEKQAEDADNLCGCRSICNALMLTEIKLKSASFCELFNYPFLNKIELLRYIFTEV